MLYIKKAYKTFAIQQSKNKVTVTCINNRTDKELGSIEFKSKKLKDSELEAAMVTEFEKRVDSNRVKFVRELFGQTGEKTDYLPGYIAWLSSTEGDVEPKGNRSKRAKYQKARKARKTSKAKKAANIEADTLATALAVALAKVLNK